MSRYCKELKRFKTPSHPEVIFSPYGPTANQKQTLRVPLSCWTLTENKLIWNIPPPVRGLFNGLQHTREIVDAAWKRDLFRETQRREERSCVPQSFCGVFKENKSPIGYIIGTESSDAKRRKINDAPLSVNGHDAPSLNRHGAVLLGDFHARWRHHDEWNQSQIAAQSLLVLSSHCFRSLSQHLQLHRNSFEPRRKLSLTHTPQSGSWANDALAF